MFEDTLINPEETSYDDLKKDAKLLAKKNWKLLAKLNELPEEQRWYKFGLWEYDEKKRNYKCLLWEDLTLTSADLERLKNDYKNKKQKLHH